MRIGQSRWTGAWVTLGLSAFAFAVAGYHPYAEDGGVYVAGVEKLLQPELFPTWSAFVTEHLRISLFAPLVAALVRGTHVPLAGVLLALYFAGIWATLYGGWMLAARCVASLEGRVGAVALLSCWLTLPVAGTSLIAMDPYVTARTLSTPLTLMALAWALDWTLDWALDWALDWVPARRARRAIWCGLALTAAALVHPLMAGYGLAAIALVGCMGAREQWVRKAGPWALAAFAVVGAGVVQASAPPESADYLLVAVTRYYWFPARWEWFEWLGLLGPVAVILALQTRRAAIRSANDAVPGLVLGRAAVALAAISFAVACLYSREGLGTHLVARLQPLRCFQLVYLVMALLLGAWVGEAILCGRVWRWLLLLTTLGGLMGFVQTQIYANSAHVEWPGSVPRNAWEQAFLWARQNTPADALFALDARYITRGKGEDAQCFRAIAERSALPDYSKDGGEASITPDLTAAWVVGQAAQTGLETESDAARAAKLRPLGVGWVVLERASETAWVCPYANERVKICRVP